MLTIKSANTIQPEFIASLHEHSESSLYLNIHHIVSILERDGITLLCKWLQEADKLVSILCQKEQSS